MTQHSSKSYSFYSPPSLTEPSDAYSTRRALSRLKSDGHSFLSRISSKLRRTKSQYNLSGISSASNLEKSKTLEHKHSTANLRECDSRYEAARYLKRREQVRLVSAADPRHTCKKSSAKLAGNTGPQPTSISAENFSEKSRWISGLKHYLSTRNKENDSVKHHKKSKSVPVSTFRGAFVSDTSQHEKLSGDSSYSGILVNKHSSKSLRYTTIQKALPGFVEAKPQPLQRHESETPANTILDQPQNSSSMMASNITVKSEDLTAKEFADITGIKICSDDEISEVNLATVKSNCLSQKTSSGFGDEEMHSIKSLHSTPHTTVHSTYNRQGSSDCHSRSSSTNKKLQIWEQEFWSNTAPLPINCSTSGSQEDLQTQIAWYPLSKSKSLHDQDNEPKFISRRRNTTHNATSPLAKHQEISNSEAQSYAEILPDATKLLSTSRSQPPVLRRGRFEITIENAIADCQLTESIKPTDQNQLLHSSSQHSSSQHSTLKTDNPELPKGDIIEWKRKRK